MKFLVMMTPRETFYTQPFSVQRQIFTRACDILNQMKNEGKIEVMYTLPGRFGIMFILESKNGEELWEQLNRVPGIGLTNIQVEPLSDFNQGFDAVFKNLETGDEMMPGGTVK